jgi:N6-L-threonylcarbamoyladenine synthase
MQQLIRAADETEIHSLALAGGVSANSGLRKRLREEAETRGWQTFIPALEYCTDNGAIISIAGYFAHLWHKPGSLKDPAKARWSMG